MGITEDMTPDGATNNRNEKLKRSVLECKEGSVLKRLEVSNLAGPVVAVGEGNHVTRVP